MINILKIEKKKIKKLFLERQERERYDFIPISRKAMFFKIFFFVLFFCHKYRSATMNIYPSTLSTHSLS